MKTRSVPLAAALCLTWLTGCTGVHKTGTSNVDPFDGVKVDQMTGNQIAPRVLAKSILCLNARRETRWVTVVTNTTITTVTNVTITPVTNLTISIATNYQYSLMTNLAALPPAPPSVVATGEVAAVPPVPVTPAVGTPPPAVEAVAAAATNTPAQLSTNLTISQANNNSGTTAPSQVTANNQSVRSYNNQLTTASNNLTISLMTNRVVTAETNLIVTWVTNSSVGSHTNITLIPTNYPVADYFLVSELIPPPDFNLAGGESLILLVDGMRYGFASSQPGTAFISRRGYNSTLYEVPPEVLVAIANAREVRVRFKGVNNTLERTMSAGCKQHFRDFLLKYFIPAEVPAAQAPEKMASAHP